jgi:hypothetical protein
MNMPRPSKGGGGSIRDQKLLAWCGSAILRRRASSLKIIIPQKWRTHNQSDEVVVADVIGELMP